MGLIPFFLVLVSLSVFPKFIHEKDIIMLHPLLFILGIAIEVIVFGVIIIIVLVGAGYVIAKYTFSAYRPQKRLVIVCRYSFSPNCRYLSSSTSL